MPNTGRPSQACHACRKRRAKCDLVHPHCSQCVRRGQVCPGYRDLIHLRFIVEDTLSYPSALSRDNRKRRTPEPSPSPTTANKRPCHSTIEERDVEAYSNHYNYTGSSVKSAFPIDMTPQMTPGRFPLDPVMNPRVFVMSRIVSGSVSCHDSENLDHFNDLNDVILCNIQQATAGSLLERVCDAISLAYITNDGQPAEFNENKAHACQSALEAIKAALQDPQQRTLDSTLVAVWMIDVYKLLFTAHVNIPVASDQGWSWCSNMLWLIRLRGPEQFTRQDGRSLIWAISYCIYSRCLITSRKPPVEGPLWFDSISKISSRSSDRLFAGLFTYVYHCTRLYSQIQVCLQTKDLNYVLSTSASVLHEMDCLEEHVEPSTNAVDHIIPRPLASHPSLNPNNMSLRSIINCIYLSNFRLHISSAVLVFLQAASRSSVCTPQQRKLFLRRQDQCMWEFWSISERVLELFRHLEFRGEEDCLSVSRLGWVDAMMVAGALKTIAESQLSLSWQRKMVQYNLVLFRK